MGNLIFNTILINSSNNENITWVSGIIWGDGGHTAWGIMQERGGYPTSIELKVSTKKFILKNTTTILAEGSY